MRSINSKQPLYRNNVADLFTVEPQLIGKILLLVFFNLHLALNYKMIGLKLAFHRNELLLQDGFFIDFLQKQTLDLWLRQYVLATGSIFSERIVFEAIVKSCFKYFLWPAKMYIHFESSNISDLVLTTVYLFTVILVALVSLFFVL